MLRILLDENHWLSSCYLTGISWSIKETAGNSGSSQEGREQLKSRNSFSTYAQLPKPSSTYSLSSFFRGKEWWLKGQRVLLFSLKKKKRVTQAMIFIYSGRKRLLKDKELSLELTGIKSGRNERNSEGLDWVLGTWWTKLILALWQVLKIFA